MSRSSTAECETLVGTLRRRAVTNGDDTAYIFLADGFEDERRLTWSGLHRRASAIGAVLQDQDATGERVLLGLPSGLPFIEALFGCWYAGAVAVPICLPRHRRTMHRLASVVADAQPRLAFGNTGDVTAGVDIASIDLEAIPDDAGADWLPDEPDAARPALLQYTSGATGAPKGVVVTHANLSHNCRACADALGYEPHHTVAGWLPLYHDMGLIGLVIEGAYVGSRSVLMSPERFLMRPVRWLQVMSRYGAVGSAAPNFAYDLCVDKIGDGDKASLDLSAWRVALNGAEPVRARTMERFTEAFAPCGFRAAMFSPCYGLAEATLFVTGVPETESAQVARPDHPVDTRTAELTFAGGTGEQAYMSCGRPAHDQRVVIVDPEAHRTVPDGHIGEIWVAGPGVTAGYWNQEEATRLTFTARLQDDNDTWLRTGDLGFVRNGELFVTGRLRELIIVAGRNHFPADLEQTVESAHPDLARSASAAFAAEVDGVERLVVAAELNERHRKVRRGEPAPNCAEIVQHVRSALTAGHELAPHDVVLLRPNGLPRTTSGKIRRLACRDAYLSETLEQFEGAVHAP